MMEVFAGFAAHVDHHMGRMIDAVKEMEAFLWKDAATYEALPLDWRAVKRLNAELQRRPSLARESTSERIRALQSISVTAFRLISREKLLR